MPSSVHSLIPFINPLPHLLPPSTPSHGRQILAGDMLNNLLNVVPELNEFANLHLKVAFNKDSSRVGPKEWGELALLLHHNRKHYDAFLVVHGTDTLAYTASALSLMLLGFKKPIVMTGGVFLLTPITPAVS